MLTRYARLIFNCNELPKEVEHTNAYFRRFLIVPFDITIPEKEQDKHLANKIIDKELSGVFNWVLEGLNRLLKNGKFSDSEAVKKQLSQYQLQSNSVHLFLDEEGYSKSISKFNKIKDLFDDYRAFCCYGNYHPVNKTNFKKRLAAKGIFIEKKNIGYVAFLGKE